MNELREVPRIKAAHDWLAKTSEAAVEEALGRGDMPAVVRLQESRDMLERGVFVLLFGQFEQYVNEMFERARERRASNTDWRVRRGWDTPALTGRRLAFETRLALVLDRRTLAYRSVIRAYGLRNHLAHGGTAEPLGSIETFVADLYGWQAALEG